MYRRVVSLLLLPGLLLSQAAVACHTHGEETPAGHDLRPHVHLTAPSAAHTHDHDHHGHGHTHHHGHTHDGHGGHQHDDEDAPDEVGPTPPTDTPADHDNSAVFVPEITLVVEQTAAGLQLTALVWWVGDVPTVSGGTVTPPSVVFRSHPPPPFDPFRPLYLRHLALLM